MDDEGLSDKYVHNHLTLFGTMLRAAAAFKVPWLLSVPKFNKPKISLFSTDYQWLRTLDEIRRFLVAARDVGELVFMLFLTAVYTGLRAGELAALEWPAVDLDRRLITVHKSYAGPTKSGRVRHAPILDPLLPELRTWKLRHPGRLLFPSRDGTMLLPSARIFQETLHAVLEATGFPKVQRGKKERPYIRFHDLRHTFASHWVLNGGDVFRLSKILGHASITMTMRYAHLAPDAFAADYARIGSALPLAGEVVHLGTMRARAAFSSSPNGKHTRSSAGGRGPAEQVMWVMMFLAVTTVTRTLEEGRDSSTHPETWEGARDLPSRRVCT